MKVEELLKSNDKKDIGIDVPDDWQSVSYDCDQFALPTHYKKVSFNFLKMNEFLFSKPV